MKTTVSTKNNYYVENTYNTASMPWYMIEGIIADVREAHDCMEDNAQAIVITTPDFEFILFTPEDNLEESIILMFMNNCTIFQNISILAQWLVHYRDVTHWTVGTKIMTLEALEH